MKIYNGKKLKKVIKEAVKDNKIKEEELEYKITKDEKKFAEIEVYSNDDIANMAQNYIAEILKSFNLEFELNSNIVNDEDLLNINIISKDESNILIGKGGRNLNSLNILLKGFLRNNFKKKFKTLIDINNYKSEKYLKLIEKSIAIAENVITTKNSAKLYPMSADERRVIHNNLSNRSNIKTKSEGIGSDRHIIIEYVEEL